jgi:hypothetical protein
MSFNWIDKFHKYHQEHKSDFFVDDEDSYIYTAIPEYSKVPSVELVDGLQLMEQEDIDRYFTDILNSNCRIKLINGIPTNMDFTCLYCDYCGTSIEDKFYYCWICHKDMCNLCYGETDADIAQSNGAKNYELRREALDVCRKHNLQERSISLQICYCDICGASLSEGDLWTNAKLGNYDRKDVCCECAETDEGKALISTDKLEKVHYDLLQTWNYSNFGSLLDWIPIYRDVEYNMILINCNKNSSLVGTFALMSNDDHGRSGYYTLSKDWSLEKIQESLREYHNNQAHDEHGNKLSGWDEFYNLPIKRLMTQHNMEIHYG